MRHLYVLFFLFLIQTAHSQVLINEISSKNEQVIKDEDGEYPDWIELYNPNGSTVDLAGYYLSDDPLNPTKWQIQEALISDYLMVFASGNDRTSYVGDVEPWGALGLEPYAYADDSDLPKGNSSYEPLDFFPDLSGQLNGENAVSVRLNLVQNNEPGGLGYSYAGLTLDIEGDLPKDLESYNVLEITATISEGMDVGVRIVQEGLASWLGYTFYIEGNGISDYVYEIPLYNEMSNLDLSVITGVELVAGSYGVTDITVTDLSFELEEQVGLIGRNSYAYAEEGVSTVQAYEYSEIQSLQNGKQVLSATFQLVAGSWSGVGTVINDWNQAGDLNDYESAIITGYLELGKELYIRFAQNDEDTGESYAYKITGTGVAGDEYVVPFDKGLMGLKNIDRLQIEAASVGESSFTFTDIKFKRSPESLVSGNLHANFKISSSGETLLLSDPNGLLVDQVVVPVLDADVSYGRIADGDPDWQLFVSPTPNNTNQGESHLGFCEQEILFSSASGFYSSGLQIALSGSGEIHYTTDGSIPDESSTIYSSPIDLLTTTVIKAACFEDGKTPKNYTTNTYFIDYDTELPVWSISTHPGNLFDEDTGIYVLGPDGSYDPSPPYFDANFWEKDWERPVQLEFFESDGSLAFQENAGIKIFGNYSRSNPKKSLALFFRSKYGASKLEYPLFPDYPGVKQFDDLILRGSGNDYASLLFRDGFHATLMEDANFEKQKYRPSVVFINGEYWGIHNIREKSNSDFFEENNNIDKDDIDLMSHYYNTRTGDGSSFIEFMQNLRNGSLSYEEVDNTIDLESFIDYFSFEIYIANYDWPNNNIKYWRQRSVNGKWRWFMYDTDFSTGLYGGATTHYTVDQFAQAYTFTEDVYWPNSDESTLLFRRLMQFPEIQKAFVNRYCDLINTKYKASYVLSEIDKTVQVLEDEIVHNHARWNLDVDDWNSEVDNYKDFWSNRAGYARSNMQNHLGLDSEVTLTLQMEPAEAGYIVLNTINVQEDNWQGVYFKGVPVTVKVVENPGYSFVGWESDQLTFNDPSQKELGSVNIETGTTLKAVFSGQAEEVLIAVSELNYNSSSDHDTGDWLEIHNYGDNEVDLSDWVLKDERRYNSYVFKSKATISPGEYLVLCNDRAAFELVNPGVVVYDEIDFSLSNSGENIYLYNQLGELKVGFKYEDKDPWPTAADGQGGTLQLLSSNLDPSDAASWGEACLTGTPTFAYDPTCNWSVTSLNDFVEEGSVNRVFPNPTNGDLFFTGISAKEMVKVELFSLEGELLKTLTGDSVNIADMREGVYVLRLSLVSGKQEMFKVIKY